MDWNPHRGEHLPGRGGRPHRQPPNTPVLAGPDFWYGTEPGTRQHRRGSPGLGTAVAGGAARCGSKPCLVTADMRRQARGHSATP
jgi:hypothetical protein